MKQKYHCLLEYIDSVAKIMVQSRIIIVCSTCGIIIKFWWYGLKQTIMLAYTGAKICGLRENIQSYALLFEVIRE